MPLTNDELLDSLISFNAQQIQLAGQRYTPGVEPGAPNLIVAPLLTAVESTGCSPAAKERFTQLTIALIKDWDRAKHFCKKQKHIQHAINTLETLVITLLPRICARDATALDEWKAHLSSIVTDLEVEQKRWHDENARVTARESKEISNDHHGHSSERNTIQSNINAISRCIGTVTEELNFVESSAGKPLVDPFLLIRGEWGTGKTHLLCDVTKNRSDLQQATLLVLAKSFQGSANLLELICRQIAPGLSAQEFIDHLQAFGVSRGERALIIIDGVNEGRRVEWRQAIGELLILIRNKTHVGLIVSCRTPFEHIAIAEHDLVSFHEITHHGFEDQEFDAQAAFFHHYKLPLPEVPLLDSEFSRPLTLKLICQSLKDLTGRKLSKGFSGIASGQKGMTFVLESFVNRVGKAIENEFGLPAKACWTVLKGSRSIADQRTAGFAPNMAATLKEYVSLYAANRILSAHFPTLSKKRRDELLDNLRTNGLIDEDVVWYRVGTDMKSRIVYRLPYQRFSDHLIARHLLEVHLDVSSEASVKHSLTRSKPLGRIFRNERYSQGYAYAGWAQALITEFPERVKNKVPGEKRELFYFLPRAAQRPSRYFEPFVQGLFWRDPSSFTEGTRRVINTCFNLNRSDAWDRIVDALVAISTKPKHPYHSQRLYQFLARFSMRERDLRWTEYLRKTYSSPSIQRLLAWAERLNAAEMSEDAAKELIVLFSLLLTTVVRKDRDIATKALVALGEQYPQALFEHVVITLDFNDPYVPERMLAAAYGVTMSLVDTSSAPTIFHAYLGGLAQNLYRKIFKPNARHSTHHILRRDYALGIIQLAQRANCVELPKTAPQYLSPPFRQIASPFQNITSAPADVHETVKFAIHMDFGNYTIGRLIPHRANYDEKNPIYRKVRAQIEQRMFDLGYRKELFEQIDNEIGRYSMYRQESDRHTDRYGKKYSWIAYFEMYGLREACKLLPDWRIGERSSDVDVDPSFPKRPAAWSAPIPDLFGDLKKDSDEWVAGGETPDFSSLLSVPEINGISGPWILLDGFVRGEHKDIDRELFAFLRGLFVAPKDIAHLRTEFLSTDYPGNHKIPDGADDHYLYAGEAGRSARYAPELRMSNGCYKRQTEEAFDRYVEVEGPPQKTDQDLQVVRGIFNDGQTNADEILQLSSEGDEPSEAIYSFTANFPKYRKIPGIRIEIPVRRFSWESYHSAQNNFSGFYIPSPSLIQRLDLATWNREIDFRDRSGQLATAYRESGNGWKGDRYHLLYIRQDLLRQYLKATRQKFVWCNWGERGWSRTNTGDEIRSNPTRMKIFDNHLHIHRAFQELGKIRDGE